MPPLPGHILTSIGSTEDGSLAQLVEQLTFNQLVAGSNPARPTTSKKKSRKGSLAQLVEQLTFNQLVAGSNPARPTNVKRRPKGAFLLCAEFNDSNLRQVRVEQGETTEPLAATARRASKARYPARPTNVKRRPKGAFLLCAEFNDSNLRQVRVEQGETTEPLAATARRASKARYPARPTNVKRRLFAICCFPSININPPFFCLQTTINSTRHFLYNPLSCLAYKTS